MSIENAYLEMIGEAAGNSKRPADRDVGEKTPDSLKPTPEQAGTAPEAKIGPKVAPSENGDKLEPMAGQSGQPGTPNAGRASVKGRTLPSKDGDKISGSADSDGVKDKDLNAGEGEWDGQPRTVVSDMTKKDLGEMYADFIRKYEDLVLENGGDEYDEGEAQRFFIENFLGLDALEQYTVFVENYETLLKSKNIFEYDTSESFKFFLSEVASMSDSKGRKSKKFKSDEKDDDSAWIRKVEESFDSKSMKFKLQEQLGALLESEGLTDDFKSTATTIFETAVNDAAMNHVKNLQEHMANVYTEKLNEHKTYLDKKVGKYLDCVVEKWVEDNRLAIESASRNNIAESFMSKLHDLLEEHYVHLPKDKADLYEREVSRANSMQSQLREMASELKKAQTKLMNAEKRIQVESFVKGMTEVEADKIRTLAESVEFDENFSSKLSTIKQNYFPSTKRTSRSMISEDMVPAHHEEHTPSKNMQSYLEALNALQSSEKI